MRFPNPILIAAALIVALATWSCQPGGEEHSELFNKIFRLDQGETFRGVNLGMPLEKTKEIEGANPKHDDKWGYVFEFNLGEDRRFFLEYISKDQDKKIVSSIVANIILVDGSEATDLYNEMEAYLRSRYGVGDGTFGDLKWKHEEDNLYVTLRMLDDKKAITLNFVPATGY